jgi:hypothetical protein
MKNKHFQFLLPIILFFVVMSIFFLAGKNFLEKNGLDQSVLLFGNLILFTATLLSYFIAMRGLAASNPNVFVRSAYMSIMIKLFICIIAALIYIFMFRKQVNKPALFTCMGLYLIYTFLEVSVLTRFLKRKKNA